MAFPKHNSVKKKGIQDYISDHEDSGPEHDGRAKNGCYNLMNLVEPENKVCSSETIMERKNENLWSSKRSCESNE